MFLFLVTGCLLLVIVACFLLLVVCFWLLVARYLLLIARCWLFLPIGVIPIQLRIAGIVKISSLPFIHQNCVQSL